MSKRKLTAREAQTHLAIIGLLLSTVSNFPEEALEALKMGILALETDSDKRAEEEQILFSDKDEEEDEDKPKSVWGNDYDEE